jgi:hypothetical protein
MESSWGIATIWMGLALVASFLSIRYKLSVALVEILVGIAAGNLALLLDHYQVFGLHWQLKANEWIAFLAGFGSILLTFMAGAEIEPTILRKYLKESLAIGVASFAAPFVGAMLYARFVGGWDWNAAMVCGIALSTTSVAVVYAVMIETGLNETDFGKLILAACFITDFGTVIALGACFANYDWSLVIFVVVAALALWLAPRFVRWFFTRFSTHVSEPGVKMVFFVLFGLGGAGRPLQERGGPAGLHGRPGAGRRVRPPAGHDPSPAHDGLRLSNAILLPQRRDEGPHPRSVGRPGTDRRPTPGEAGGQTGRRLAAHPLVPLRRAREQLYDLADVHGPDVRHDQRPVRAEQRLHRPGAVLGPGDRGHRQRHCADRDRPILL